MTKDRGQTRLGASFFVGMALLVAAVTACIFGLGMLWTAISDPEPNNVARAGEAAALGVLVHEANMSYRPRAALKERLQRGPGSHPVGTSERVREAAGFMLDGDGEASVRLDTGLEELVQRQEGDVLKWRLRRGFLFVLPVLALGMAAGWLGLRILRRLKMAGTVFASESAASPPVAAAPSPESHS